MRIRIVGIPVQNQENALIFYTEKLGFVKKLDCLTSNTPGQIYL